LARCDLRPLAPRFWNSDDRPRPNAEVAPCPYALLRDILKSVKTIAVVGLSAHPTRSSREVFEYLKRRGYKMSGVNPGLAGHGVSGAPVYGHLADIPELIDMVDILRNSAQAAAVVDEALALVRKPNVMWMQLGVRDDDAAARAEAHGVRVIMNRCPKIEYARLIG